MHMPSHRYTHYIPLWCFVFVGKNLFCFVYKPPPLSPMSPMGPRGVCPLKVQTYHGAHDRFEISRGAHHEASWRAIWGWSPHRVSRFPSTSGSPMRTFAYMPRPMLQAPRKRSCWISEHKQGLLEDRCGYGDRLRMLRPMWLFSSWV